MSYRDSYIEVDLDAIYHNIQTIQKKANKAFFAVIKANGYGLGDEEMAKIAIEAGAEYLCVSSLDEALSLRKKGICFPILILGYVDASYLSICKEHQLTLTTTSLEWVNQIHAEAKDLLIHLKVDTGMNRIGLKNVEEVKQALNLLREANIEGIYTHYACSDQVENKLNKMQYDSFKSIVEAVDYTFKFIHTSNSDAAISFKDEITNAVRVGIGMIGYSTDSNDLLPSVALKSKVIHCHQIKKGQSVSYSAHYTAEQDTWVLTLPIGYADGWIRQNEGRKVYVGQEYGEIVGAICMDQMMVRVSQPYPLLEEVELFGPHISIQSVAKDLNTITYEILTLLSDRLTKKYIRNHQ
ncbi:MAG: alanine racemase, partial [Erysipelotrichaceae bacterium]